MKPVTFAGCFGWLHAPLAPADIGVVLCAAHGFEALGAHKSWRLLADAFAEAGYPTMRFDYHGAGDSLGGDADPGRVDAWLRSIADAIDTLKASTGVSRVVLAGLRLGGTLAAQSAQTRSDIAALALLAPIVSGRTYVRELQAMAQMMAQPASAGGGRADGNIEASGFLVTAATLDSLRSIDLRKAVRPPAPSVFIASPGGAASGLPLAHAYETLGAHVTLRDFDDYARLVCEPTLALHPRDSAEALVAWVCATVPPRGGRPRRRVIAP